MKRGSSLLTLGFCFATFFQSIPSFAFGSGLLHAFDGQGQSQYSAGAYSSNPAERFAADYVHADDPQIQALAQQLTEGKTDDHDKIQAIFQWIKSNVRYDYSEETLAEPADEDALSVMRQGMGVCGGIASLSASLLDASGVPTKVVIGTITGPNSTPCDHSWDKVLINGNWIDVDATYFLMGYKLTYMGDHTECDESNAPSVNVPQPQLQQPERQTTQPQPTQLQQLQRLQPQAPIEPSNGAFGQCPPGVAPGTVCESLN